MKKLLCLLALVLPMAAHAATVGAVASTNRLMQFVNPNTDLTNYFVMSDVGVIADGSAAIWTYDASSNVDDTNHIKPLLYGGRWVRNPMGGTNSYSFLVGVTQTNYTIIGRTNVTVTQVISGTNSTIYLDSGGGGVTNFFDTTIITNLTVVSNVTFKGRTIFNDYVTINTNVYITNGGNIYINGTNVPAINPTVNYLPVRSPSTNFDDSFLYQSGTSLFYRPAGADRLELGQQAPNYPFIKFHETGNATIAEISQVGGILNLTDSTGLQLSSPALTTFEDTFELFAYNTAPHVKLYGYAFGGNYSRLDVYHGGTNDAIHFDSQSAGIAGDPRPFYFDARTTNLFRFLPNVDQPEIHALDKNGVTAVIGVGSAVPFFSGSANIVAVFSSGAGIDIDGSAKAVYPSAAATNQFLGKPTRGWGGIVLTPITKAAKTALSPADGMIVYQSDNTPGLRAYINGTWVILSTAADP